MEKDREVEPLLLGRPFLATGRALIDVERGFSMFNVFEAMKRHEEEEPQCYHVASIEV
ncbi:proline-rich receptor-like protein kinase PERK4, partial [Trifolium medium]|nr:proline-rich receptor-like protein kinase PERK4 [Trifolium medium]